MNENKEKNVIPFLSTEDLYRRQQEVKNNWRCMYNHSNPYPSGISSGQYIMANLCVMTTTWRRCGNGTIFQMRSTKSLMDCVERAKKINGK